MTEGILHFNDWENPTEEENLREDELCAPQEADETSRFVPSSMLSRPFHRRRPMIICFSRDVPRTAKNKIVDQLEQDLPGLTMHIDDEDSMGLPVEDLLAALSARYACVDNLRHTRRMSAVQSPMVCCSQDPGKGSKSSKKINPSPWQEVVGE